MPRTGLEKGIQAWTLRLRARIEALSRPLNSPASTVATSPSTIDSGSAASGLTSLQVLATLVDQLALFNLARRPEASASPQLETVPSQDGTEPTELANSNLVQILTDISRLVLVVDLPSEVADIWELVAPWTGPDKEPQIRRAALGFIPACLKGQGNHIDTLRYAFFSAISDSQDDAAQRSQSQSQPQPQVIPDLDIKFAILIALTNDGRDIRYIEKGVVALISLWITRLLALRPLATVVRPSATSVAVAAAAVAVFTPLDEPSHEHNAAETNGPAGISPADPSTAHLPGQELVALFALFANLLRFHPAHLPADQIQQLLEIVYRISIEPVDELAEHCLAVLDIMLRYGSLRLDSLNVYVFALCRFVTDHNRSGTCWKIMKNLLMSQFTQPAMKILCGIIQGKISLPHHTRPNILRGAVFFLSISNWGRSQIHNLSYSPMYLIQCLREAARSRVDIADAEILISLVRLTRKDSHVFSMLEWDLIMQVWSVLGEYWTDRERPVQLLLGDPGLVREDLVRAQLPTLELILKLHNQLTITLTDVYLNYRGASSVAFFDRLLDLAPHLFDGLAETLIQVNSNWSWYPSFPRWIAAMSSLTAAYMPLHERPAIRTKLFEIMEQSWYNVPLAEQDLYFEQILRPFLSTLTSESDSTIYQRAVAFTVLLAKECNDAQFNVIASTLIQCSLNSCSTQIYSWGGENDFDVANPEQLVSVPGLLAEDASARAAAALVGLFGQCLQSMNGPRCITLYCHIGRIAALQSAPTSVRLVCWTFLTRLRADVEYWLICPVQQDSDAGTPQAEQAKAEDALETFIVSRHVVCNTTTSAPRPSRPSARPNASEAVLLPVDKYCNLIAKLLREERDWPVLWHILTYFSPQLRNVYFFQGVSPIIQSVQDVIHDLITGEKAGAAVSNLPSNVRKTDIYLSLCKILTVLLSYQHHVPGPKQDELISTFISGMQKWPAISKFCVHALTLALMEIPERMAKHTQAITTVLAQKTTFAMGTPSLEFLSTLARLPNIWKNLTQLDFRAIFGIAIQYIQIAQDHLQDTEKQLGEYILHLAYHVVSRWFVNIKLPDRKKYIEFIISLLLVSAGDRKFGESAELVLDMMIQNSFVDCWPKPPPEVIEESNLRKKVDRGWIQGNCIITARILTKPRWMEISIRRPSAMVSMWVRLENRFKTSDSASVYLPAPLSSHWLSEKDISAMASAEEGTEASPVGGQLPDGASPAPQMSALRKEQIQALDPSFIVSQLLFFPTLQPAERPVLLPDDDATTRTISVLDRCPVVDLHKIGVVYCGPGQDTEQAILLNSYGSRTYSMFIQSLGSTITLKGCRDVYTGGLDTTSDVDGKYAIIWQDDFTQIVYHIATLMPNPPEDANGIFKKRHIGNDFVLVVFNESGLDYKFDTIPGQFNYVNIVVTPVGAKNSATAAVSIPSESYANRHFQVAVQMKDSMEKYEVGSMLDAKVVSGDALGSFVRQIAMHVNLFAQIHMQSERRTEYCSNMRERLRQIKRFRDRLPASTVSADPEKLLDFSRFT
ncbi:uncharacterized protein BJ171DRAFT_208701 [Polychytrium aggregatum]|uniref:uncharacterized protein n=1 Tax=Polychytrium aggregatum TaxID=110093 RepID=UPI0022FE4D8C|nr:uncharacterized protein BJ171DRAFT_208701 [Polychytrium aggregatum]KAI9208492.1 hypothetical protein BJ171DRAFT_208701 [Polychytrium aggregatum]